jgi:hypothetical protein
MQELCRRGSAFDQQLGNMQHAQWFLLAANQSTQVHQTRHVGGCQHFRSGCAMIGDPISSHQARHGLFGHCKCSAETAAFIRARKFG